MLAPNPTPRWLINYQPRPEARIRLVCAHHAGGSAQYFENWLSALPDYIEMMGVNLPGRASRRNEPLVQDIGSVVDAICADLTPCFDRPYAMFGDSIGALVCFEVIRELRRRGEPLPLRLFASGMVAPHIVWWNPEAPLHQMEDEALFEGLVRDAGMLDEATLSDADLREVMTPVLRADLQIAETYQFKQEPPLELPITASRGDADILLIPEQLQGWSEHTSKSFEHLTFAGAHFYSRQSQNELLGVITTHLQNDLAAMPVSMVDGKTHAYPQKCLHEIFTEQAGKTPDAPALIQHQQQYSYQELDAETDALARWLVKSGVKPGDMVGILMERCVEHVVALIAINKAGGIFMPLDTAYPSETLEKFIRASQARLFLSKPQWIDRLPSTVQSMCQWVSLGEHWQEMLTINQIAVDDVPLPKSRAGDTAFMSMSSGTSGAPKGICQSHRACVNAYWHRYVYAPYGEQEREACNVYFIWYVWLPLLRGASAWIVPDAVIYDPRLLASYIAENKITRSTISPSLLESVLRTPGLGLPKALQSLRNVTIIGEVVPSTLANDFFAVAPDCTLTQGYGCAETHDAASIPLAPHASATQRVAPTGKPQINQRIYVLDENGKPLPRGVAGEIYVGGDSLASGYFLDEENTALRFVPDPVRPEFGRLFKTGDRGRILPDGNLQVLGRIDSMVKLRGYSVQIGVVEGALLAHPAISNVAVVAAMDNKTGRPDHLVAYVVAAESSDDWSTYLRPFLADRLPHYAIPSFVVSMQSLPVDGRSNSKLDRRALPVPGPEHRLDTGKEQTPPRNDQEIAIAQIWRTILEVDTAGVHDDFFAHGGHSLLAAELCGRINERLGSTLRVADVFEKPTIAQLSEGVV